VFGDLFDSLQRPDVKQKDWMLDPKIELILGTAENLSQAVDECINAPLGVYGLDLETTGLDNRVFEGRTVDSIVGVGISPNPNKAYYFPLAHSEGHEHNIPWRLFGEQFTRLFDLDVKARPVVHNSGFDLEFLEFNGHVPLGEERWDDHLGWEDTHILAYLLDSRTKGKKGLKYLSKTLVGLEMIELDELIHDTIKDYSTLDPSWEPCVWYAAADPLCTLRIWEVLNKRYTEAPEHTSFLYGLEKTCATSVRWMHRNRVYVNQERTLKLARDGQREWFDALLEVYKGASEILGRDIEPTYIKIMKGEISNSENRFDPNEIGNGQLNYKSRVDEARKEADRVDRASMERSVLLKRKITSNVPSLLREGDREDIDFPYIYDVASPQQLGLLFRELQLPGLQTTGASGQVATGASILDRFIEDLEGSYPFLAKIKRYRELAKALSQYLVPMIEDVAQDGTLKPKFDQFATDTGRFSCKVTKDPIKTKDGGCRVPFQGIPATYDTSKPECVRQMRSCIQAREEGWWLAAIDYAGVELRLITNLSREPKWIKEFFRCSDCNNTFPQEVDEEGFARPTPPICPCGSDKIGDIHTLTAVAFYGEGAKATKEWKALRQNAKGCNFALCYGGTGRAVVRTIECSEEEGEEKYNTFIKTYRTLYGWWQNQHKYSSSHEFVQTAFGRVLPMPEINSKERKLRSKDERKSVNSPVQGTSADITKLAMGLIYKGIKKNGWMDKFKMILTVHDEIVFEIHESILKEAIDFVCKKMVRNGAIKAQGWPIPLLVDVELGTDWTVPYDLKDLKKGYSTNKKGEPVYDLPDSLVEIFKQEVTDAPVSPVPSKEPEIAISTASESVFHIKELTEIQAVELAYWIKDQTREGLSYKIFHQGKDITVLFR